MDSSTYSLLLPAEPEPHAPEANPRVDPPCDKTLAEVWAASAPELASLAAALGVGRERQSDVLQDVFLTAREKRPAGLADDDLRRWLFRVTANRCRLEHRRRRTWSRVLEGLAFWRRGDGLGSDEPESSAERNELTAQVEAALSRLKVIEREIVVLRYFCNFDSREIGAMLEMPDATVRSHLAKARKQLARDLAAWKE